jgi:hypothetical protein
MQASVSTGIRWSGGGTAAAILPGFSGAPYNTHDAYTGGIDDQGNIAGYTVNVAAFRLRSGEPTVVALGDLGTGTAKNRARAVALNNRGDAIGNAPDYTTPKSGGQDRAVIWPAGGTTAVALPFLPSTTLTNKQTYANAINDTGLIAGTAKMYSGFDQVGTRAVLWSPEGFAIADLGEGTANGINNGGDVVGNIPAAPNIFTHAALWASGESTAVDLNTLIDPDGRWVLQQAADISNTGIIVGSGLFDPDGDGPLASRPAVFRLTPVPEPMATTMAGLAWCLLGRQRGRRRGPGGHEA